MSVEKLNLQREQKFVFHSYVILIVIDRLFKRFLKMPKLCNIIIKLSVVNLFPDDHDLLGRTYLMHAIHGQHEKETVENILSLNFNINHQAHGEYRDHISATNTTAFMLIFKFTKT